MRLFEMMLKESMTMWVPDAPSEEVDQECEFCDGTGKDGYYNPKSGKRYDINPDVLRKRLIEWDKQLKALDEKKRSLDSQNHMLKSFYDANIEAHPDIADKMGDSFHEIEAKKEKFERSVELRMKRIEKKIELVQKLETLDCGFCKGVGTYKDNKSDAPEMNLSNMNAQAVMGALGYEADYGYNIKPDEIPTVKRNIMLLLNKEGELGTHTRDAEDSQKDFGMVRSTDPDTGLDKIERKKGARMIGAGIDEDYLKEKLERILSILDYAQKNNMEIHFA